LANSLSFNTTDLGDYGLTLAHSDIPGLTQQSPSQLIQDISYSFQPKRPPKIINIDVDVMGSTRAILDGYLDDIKFIITHESAKVLKLDHITDRYWNTKLESFVGYYSSPYHWSGTITFKADDPMAYDNSATSSDHAIDSDPDTVVETTGGTGTILPVYTLTAKEDLGAITLKLENLTTDEELQWEGTLNTDSYVTVDVPAWVVSLDGTVDMADVSGQFPRLAANVANSIKVTGLYSSVAGVLNIAYRKRYL